MAATDVAVGAGAVSNWTASPLQALSSQLQSPPTASGQRTRGQQGPSSLAVVGGSERKATLPYPFSPDQAQSQFAFDPSLLPRLYVVGAGTPPVMGGP